jgi:phosphate transport system substrate-binding protein
MARRGRWACLTVLALTLFLAGCSATPTVPADAVLLRGAGATFPAPLYKKWIELYRQAHPKVVIDYAGVGSGEGVKRFLGTSELDHKPIDFGASDNGMTDDEIKAAPHGALLIPTTVGMVTLSYNVPGVGSGLKLPRAVYPNIFLGKITKWNDPAIVAANPGITLPDRAIVLIVRQESSGTTFALTNHLSAISDEWKTKVGAVRAARWPTKVDQAPGNAGVAARIKQTQYSLGYVDLADAWSAGLTTATLENKAGKFVDPLPENGTQAVDGVQLPENLRAFVPDPEGSRAYPITSFTYVLLARKYESAATAENLRQFFGWCLSDSAQGQAEALGYAPLPTAVVAAAKHALADVGK